jgi:cysteine desulfurase/selenocysteine lyase
MLDDEYKKDFPLLRTQDIAYLDSAATEQRPDCVIEAEKGFYEKYNANPLRGLYGLGISATEKYEEARETVRRFINAKKTSEVIFTRNTTESINLAAYSYALTNLKPGDEILVSIQEHHSDLLPWQMAAARTGAKLVFLECDKEGHFTDEAVRKAVTGHTKLAAVALISNVLGCLNPVRKIITAVHAVGGVVLIDAAQAAPHIRIDVQQLDTDFLAFSGHKLMAPMGIGVLYGRENLLEAMPPFMTGGEMIDSVTREGAVFAELPHKFEAGTVNAAGAAGLKAAIDYMDSIGRDKIEKRERELTDILFARITEIPHVTVQGSRNAAEHYGIVSFTVDGVHPHDIASILDSDNVAVRAGHHCAQPLLQYLGVRSTARASIAFYNSGSDIDRFTESLASVRRRMGYGE